MKAQKWDGKPIKSPGIYADVPLEEYHSQRICAGPSVSSSGLRRVLEINSGSPAHFFSEWSGNPQAIEQEDKKAFILGRAAHHLMLGQPNFAKLFVIRPAEMRDPKTGEMKPWQGNRTVCKEWVEEMKAAGRTALSDEDVESVKGMAIALGTHPLISGVDGHGLLSGEIERSLFWQDKATGLWLKSRPDAIPTDSGDFSDLKTTPSVQWPDLVRTISKFGYHQQAALVREGAKVCLNIDMATFSLVFVEKKNPWCPRVVMLKDDDIMLGHKQNHKALELIAKCVAAKDWPGPGDDVVSHIDLTERYRESAKELTK